MYYTRTFKSGGQDWDPRQLHWAVFTCATCGANHHVDVSRVLDTFRYDQEIICPKCGCLNPEDKVKNLEAEIERLTTQKMSIEVKIDKLTEEYQELVN